MLFVNPWEVPGLGPEPRALIPPAFHCPERPSCFSDPNLMTPLPWVAPRLPDLSTYPVTGLDFLFPILVTRLI